MKGTSLGNTKLHFWLEHFQPEPVYQYQVYKSSLHYPHKISCLVMRTKLLIIHCNLLKMKMKIFRTCLQGHYQGSLKENLAIKLCHVVFLRLRGLSIEWTIKYSVGITDCYTPDRTTRKTD